jgi:hypothetical protein
MSPPRVGDARIDGGCLARRFNAQWVAVAVTILGFGHRQMDHRVIAANLICERRPNLAPKSGGGALRPIGAPVHRAAIANDEATVPLLRRHPLELTLDAINRALTGES